MIETKFSVENDSDSVLYVMDETALRTESNNRRTWSPVGVSPVLESNGSHQGVNIIGATEITKNFDTVDDVYDAEHTIKSTEIKEFIVLFLKYRNRLPKNRQPINTFIIIIYFSILQPNKLKVF